MDNLLDFIGRNLNIGAYGVIVTIVLAVLKRISNEKLFAFGNGVGTAITAGMSKFAWWEKVEKYFLNGFDVVWQGIMHGARSDNSKENDKNRDIEYEDSVKK